MYILRVRLIVVVSYPPAIVETGTTGREIESRQGKGVGFKNYNFISGG
jgi:hypothetical protein